MKYILRLSDFHDIVPVSTIGTSAIYNGIYKNGMRFYIKEVIKPSADLEGAKKPYTRNEWGVYAVELATNELLASILYNRVYGLPAIHLFLIVNDVHGNGLQRYLIGSVAIEMDSCDVMSKDCVDLYTNRIAKGVEGLLVDAILANWDIASTGNVGILSKNIIDRKSGRQKNKRHGFRVDVGGSLLFRALGAPRRFLVEPTEHQTFFHPDNISSHFFRSLTCSDLDLVYSYVDGARIDTIPEILRGLKSEISKTMTKRDKERAFSVLNEAARGVQMRHQYYVQNRDTVLTVLKRLCRK